MLVIVHDCDIVGVLPDLGHLVFEVETGESRDVAGLEVVDGFGGAQGQE